MLLPPRKLARPPLPKSEQADKCQLVVGGRAPFIAPDIPVSERQGATGTYFIKNNASAQVSLAANTLSGNVSFPTTINAGATVIGTAQQTNGRATYVGTFIYKDVISGYGCTFTTTVIRSTSTGLHTFSFTAAPYGTDSPAVCTLTPSSTNPSTGTYSANAQMSGF